MAKMVCIQDFENYAKDHLHPKAWAFFSQGAEREFTLKENLQTFTRYALIPRMLRNVALRDLSVTVLGEKMSLPFGIAPVAYHKLAHPDGEIATSRAASEVGAIFSLSTVSSSSIEDVARNRPKNTPLWFQLYFFTNRKVTEEIVSLAKISGYKALVLTVDCPTMGLRFKEWSKCLDLPPQFRPPNVEEILNKLEPVRENKSYNESTFETYFTWKDVAWLKSITKLPIVLKGILSVEDAVQAVKYGVSGVWLSNHGGRQLDGVPSALDVLPGISRALSGSGCEVYMDGGIRWGSDILKALALGARTVFIGRPVIWGLTHSGQNGVRSVLDILTSELDKAMLLSGCQSISDIGPHLIQKHVFAKM